MKFGLLVVLAVAVLVPSLSEGRTVSRCELKKKLGQAITLPTRLQKFKKEYLAIVICEVNSRSRLNTGLVKVFGKRPTTTQSTTTKPTTTQSTTTEPTTTQPTTTQSTTTEPTTTQSTTTEPTTTQPTTTQSTTTEPTTTQSTTTEPTTTQSTTTEPTTTQSTTTELTTTQSTNTELTTTAPTTTQPIPTGTNRTGAGNNRRKREASSEESDSVEMDLRLEELLNWHNETADEDEAEKGGERKKRSSKDRSSEETKQSSFGLYGIFQLSDETFCNSGYRSSKNKCNTACNAFTDDNIMDDIDCFVKTDQWGLFLKSASRECRYRTKNFFDECK